MSNHDSAIHPIWVEPPVNLLVQEEFKREFNIHPVTAQVLISRGMKSIKEVHDFLYAKLPNLLDPELFPQMDKAVERIYQAREKHQRVLVFGDNDVDGITGTTLLTEFLRYVGLKVHFFVANRNSITGSPIVDALNYAIKNNCQLMITVDCGITAVDEIQQIHEKNIDVIITDHHEPTDVLPLCVATLNPKLINSTYPNRDLTGVGVAFKLAHAFTKFLISHGDINPDDIDLKRYLDLVALGTVADMGSLINENRILVRYGLTQLHKTKRIGLVKLMKICGIKTSEASPADIASKLAPRL
ncbi:MAG: single-stranded-DNA-specific exonuclease RecJ, partial [Chlamydiae bacterium]|nr:single-stranded-DNA-specific exonuclease RecJ [Chlamydiota bacterium]